MPSLQYRFEPAISRWVSSSTVLTSPERHVIQADIKLPTIEMFGQNLRSNDEHLRIRINLRLPYVLTKFNHLRRLYFQLSMNNSETLVLDWFCHDSKFSKLFVIYLVRSCCQQITCTCRFRECNCIAQVR